MLIFYHITWTKFFKTYSSFFHLGFFFPIVLFTYLFLLVVAVVAFINFIFPLRYN